MNLIKKKEHILRCVRLGMELFRAELVAECTEKEIEKLEEDEEFRQQVEQHYALEEYNLLVKHNNAMNVAIMTGRTSAIQWKLERLNPRRWSSGEDDSSKSKPLKLQVNLVGVSAEKED